MDPFFLNGPSNERQNLVNLGMMGIYHKFEELVYTNYRPNEWRECGKQILNEFQKKWDKWSPPSQTDLSGFNLRKRQRVETETETENPKRRKLTTGFHSYCSSSLDQIGPVYGLGSRAPKYKEVRYELIAKDTKQEHRRKFVNRSTKSSISPLKFPVQSIRKVRKDVQTKFVGDGTKIWEQVLRDTGVEELTLSMGEKLNLDDDDAMNVVKPIDGYMALSSPQNCGIDKMWPMSMFSPINETCDLVERKLSLD